MLYTMGDVGRAFIALGFVVFALDRALHLFGCRCASPGYDNDGACSKCGRATRRAHLSGKGQS